MAEPKYKSTLLPQTMTADDVGKGHLDLLAKINQTFRENNDAAELADTNAAAAQSTADLAISSAMPWSVQTPYTPIFSTSFGTVTNINFYWARFSAFYYIWGTWTCGNTTAAEARIGLPVTSIIASIVTAISGFGSSYAGTGNQIFSTLALGGKSYLNFGIGTVSGGIAAQNANALWGNNSNGSLFCMVPIEGLG